MARIIELDDRLRAAVRHFWTVREAQSVNQGRDDDEGKDRGGRSAVTGGKQMDGFVRLLHDLLVEAGISRSMIFCSTRRDDELENADSSKIKQKQMGGPRCTQTELPGWFRAEKDWDLLVIVNGALVAAIEVKSQVGSFGNNFNNRTEEALGNATDIKAAYREGAFRPSLRPWLGYLMLLEEAPKSTRPVRPSQPHFKVFKEFEQASYAKRYEILLTKLVREELYDAACFLLSPRDEGISGACREPTPELSFRNFAASLVGHATAISNVQPPPAEKVQPKTRKRTRQ